MRISEAINRLRHRSSDEDPITHNKEDKTPRDLEYELSNAYADADTTQITYWSGTRERWIKGTLSGMVRDRENDPSIETEVLTTYYKPAFPGQGKSPIVSVDVPCHRSARARVTQTQFIRWAREREAANLGPKFFQTWRARQVTDKQFVPSRDFPEKFRP